MATVSGIILLGVVFFVTGVVGLVTLYKASGRTLERRGNLLCAIGAVGGFFSLWLYAYLGSALWQAFLVFPALMLVFVIVEVIRASNGKE